MPIDLPPKLWVPQKPAIVRAAPDDLLTLRRLKHRAQRDFNAAMFGGALGLVALSGGGAAAPAPDATVSFTDSSVSGSDLTTYTFSSQALGTAATGRRILVGAGCSSTVDRTIDQITVDGNNTTEVVTASPGAGAFNRVSFRILQLDAGTTGDIVVTLSAGALRCGIGVWAIYNLLSSTATDTGSSISSAFSDTLTVSAGGVAIGYCFNFHAAGATHTWTGITENFDEDVEAGVLPHTGASLAFAAAQSPLTVTCTPTNSTSGAMVCASFR